MRSRVTIHYRFHPHFGQSLEVVLRPRRADAPVTVVDPSSAPLQIPAWMLLPAAGSLAVSATATVAPRALLALSELLGGQLTSLSDGG